LLPGSRIGLRSGLRTGSVNKLLNKSPGTPLDEPQTVSLKLPSISIQTSRCNARHPRRILPPETKFMRATFALGRLVFGGFFLYNGITHFLRYKSYAQYAAAKGVPFPEASVLGSGALLTAGGASLLLGVRPKLGASAVIGFLAAVTPVMHDFWNEESPEARQMNQINFAKNAALLGAALALAAAEEPRHAASKSQDSERGSTRSPERERDSEKSRSGKRQETRPEKSERFDRRHSKIAA
jgi:uncharacterized membrane protein YphA (DoxX/SURF4 family)